MRPAEQRLDVAIPGQHADNFYWLLKSINDEVVRDGPESERLDG